MKLKRILATALAGAMALSLAACGNSGKSSSSASGSGAGGAGVQTVSLWATGSDNVRQIYEALTKDFNENSEYKDQYQMKLNFILSGTGGQTLPNMLAAAYKASQTNTDYDLIDMGGDDLSQLVSLTGEDAYVKLDLAKIPNSSRVSAKSAVATEYCQPYRGTTVVLAYNSKNVTDPPKTMDELFQWCKDHPGRFAYNTPGTGGAGDSFARTAVYNQISDASSMTSDDPKREGQWVPLLSGMPALRS